MATLKRWAIGPYELLRHADQHRHDGGDFDRRMALISYDNAIELAITTYLDLHPSQRANRSFPEADVSKWLRNYHSKLDFLEHYVCRVLQEQMLVERAEIIYYHRIRNDLYHANSVSVPKREDVESLRGIAVWVFSILFNVDADALLAAETSGKPVEIQTTHAPSPENQIFAAVIELRKDIGALRDLIAAASAVTPTDEQVLASVLNEDAPDTSRDLIDALSRAEAIADSLADEREVAANPQELRTLQERLEQLKARVEAPLREYQATLALRAVDATLKGIDEGRHEIGYVCQSVGSGLSLTVDAYVTLLSQQLPLADWAVLIVADRSASTQQLYYRLEHLDRKGSCPVRAPGSKGFSESVRAAGTINIITIQGLMQALARDPVQKNVLLIGYDFDVIDHAVRKLLPQAHVISFLHHLVRVRPGSEPPVPIIGSYSLPEAIKDGYATPVNLLQRILPRADELDWLDPGLDEWLTVDEIDVLQPRGFRWTEAGMKLLARDIVAHFSERQQIFAGKALVVVDSIETANALCHELQRAVIHEQLGDASYVAVLSSTLSDEETRTLIWNFCREGAQPHIVVSAKRWTGIDVPLLHCAYVTCPLSRGTLLNVIGRLASLHSDKASATLVDYASNKFFHLEGFALGQATLP